MGVQQLWANLRQAGVVQELSSADKEDLQIVEALDSTAVAVDASIWVVQATLQPNLTEFFRSPTARALKVCFDRVRRSPGAWHWPACPAQVLH